MEFRKNIYLLLVFNEEAIIPNYFAPFEQKNTDIYFAASLWGEFDVFRGDADQDRPS